MTTAAELYDSARATIGLNFEDGLLGTQNESAVLTVINSGLNDLSIDHNWLFSYVEEEFQTVQGLDSYDPPEEWLMTSFLVVKDLGYELTPKQRRDHFAYTGGGAPQWYDTSGDRLLIAPVPDGAYTIVHGFYTHLSNITRASTSYPVFDDQLAAVSFDIPPTYLPLAVLFIARRLCLLMKDKEHYGMVEDQIKNVTRKMDDNRMRQTRPGRISSRRDTGF